MTVQQVVVLVNYKYPDFKPKGGIGKIMACVRWM